MRKAIVIAYVVFAIGSWFLISGWERASFDGEFPSLSKREHAGFAIMHSVPMAVIWPLGVPLMYCTTGLAEYGWKAVWSDLTPAAPRNH